MMITENGDPPKNWTMRLSDKEDMRELKYYRLDEDGPRERATFQRHDFNHL